MSGARKATRPTAAILYDFDKTLCTRDMQEYSFIPGLGLSAQEFWSEATRLSEQGMDPILAYMYLMLKKSREAEQPIRRNDFVSMGKNIAFFPGVLEWFNRISSYGKSAGLEVEHFIISSGLTEIIEGSSIGAQFNKIYACAFHYDVNGVADWPLVSVNYTTKTQFLFRINKGVLDGRDGEGLNRFVPEDERPVPFRNMVYIGDGMTDIPCIKLVKTNGGHSIAVYPKDQKEKAAPLLRDKRVDFIASADYRADKELDRLVKKILDRISVVHMLNESNRAQRQSLGKV